MCTTPSNLKQIVLLQSIYALWCIPYFCVLFMRKFHGSRTLYQIYIFLSFDELLYKFFSGKHSLVHYVLSLLVSYIVLIV